ncbi:hypothetical protein Esi_0046_0109 [Ectocarpus siliculosus]|uniref:Uncharacterized protein n=1 Tax=Ectocarpus siliculosus TaxID=2880 RepID=D7G1Z2_ECTSI|nr:hypothetical protein Esi_0046_0109 [Ectocarpus siliculosus]|eukprot:CBJ48718.1 hypothetical protein Esi_0046_0109 [Ectocarpus siliculosus]
MPSIAGFIQSLLSEDMYATGMLEKMDERISQLNAGQLRLLVSYVEKKVPGLTNPTVLDAYTKLLRKATAEREKRHEEEVHGERERLKQLKAAHAGVNAKAWDTSHASLDKELAKFQKFLKSKARRIAEEQVLQEEMEKLHNQLMALPARRAAAETKRHAWWACGAVLFAVVGPILILTLVPVGVLIAVGAFLATCVLAAVCWFVGVLSGIVVTPALDDDAIEDKTRKRAKETLKGYRAEVRRTFEATEEIFAAEMKWRDDWAEARKKERRNERRQANEKAPKEKEAAAAAAAESRAQGDGRPFSTGDARIFPEEEEEQGVNSDRCSSVGRTGPEAEEKTSGREPPDEEGGGDKGHGSPGAGRRRPSEKKVVDAGADGAGLTPSCSRGVVEDLALLTPPRNKTDSISRPENVNLDEPDARGGSVGGSDTAPVPVEGGLAGETSRESSASKRPPGDGDSGGSVEEEASSGGEASRDGLLRGPCQGSSCLLEKRNQGLEEVEEEEEQQQQQHNQVALPTAGFPSATSGGALSGGVVQETGLPSLGGDAAAANGDGTGGVNRMALSADDEGKGDMAV